MTQRRKIFKKNRVLIMAAAAAMITAGGSGVVISRPAVAQSTTPASQPPTVREVASAAPDVQVIAISLPTGEWAASAVYGHKEPLPPAKARHQQLLRLTGWKTMGEQWDEHGVGVARRDNKPIRRGTAADADAPPPDKIMTAVSFQTAANLIDFADGTMDVSPWIRAYRDQSHLRITYLLPPGIDFAFRGLRHYDDDNVSVNLLTLPDAKTGKASGTLTYAVWIKNHQLDNLTLPRYQESATEMTRRAEVRRRQATNLGQRSRALGMGLIFFFAIGAGALVYLWANRLSGNTAAGR